MGQRPGHQAGGGLPGQQAAPVLRALVHQVGAGQEQIVGLVRVRRSEILRFLRTYPNILFYLGGMPMRLYALRHGETSWNVQRRFQSQSDIPLNDKGILLAELTARGWPTSPSTWPSPPPSAGHARRRSWFWRGGTYHCMWSRGSSKWRSAFTKASRPTPGRVGR